MCMYVYLCAHGAVGKVLKDSMCICEHVYVCVYLHACVSMCKGRGRRGAQGQYVCTHVCICMHVYLCAQGAVGEVLKDAISFPIDTVRARLMTGGSFAQPDASPVISTSSSPVVSSFSSSSSSSTTTAVDHTQTQTVDHTRMQTQTLNCTTQMISSSRDDDSFIGAT